MSLQYQRPDAQLALELHKANCSWTHSSPTSTLRVTLHYLFKFCSKLLSGVTGLAVKDQCNFFGNLRSHVFTLKSFVGLFVAWFVCLFMEYVVLCLFTVCQREAGASCTKVRLGLESGASGATSDHMFHQHTEPAAARGRKAALS